jgi:dihydroorotate dehydrogenase
MLGINIGKNKDTSLEKATDDYVSALSTLHPFAEYFTLNISSPTQKIYGICRKRGPADFTGFCLC